MLIFMLEYKGIANINTSENVRSYYFLIQWYEIHTIRYLHIHTNYHYARHLVANHGLYRGMTYIQC